MLVAVGGVLALLLLSLLLPGLGCGQALDMMIAIVLVQLTNRLGCRKHFSLMLIAV